MNSKLTTVLLTIITMILIIGLFIFGWVIYLDLTNANEESITYTLDKIATEENTKGQDKNKNVLDNSIADFLENTTNNNFQSSNKNEGIDSYFFYSQLTNNQKAIYNKLKENKDNLIQGNYVIKFGDMFSTLLSQEGGSELLGDDYQTAIEAFTHDNVDLFYLDVNKMYLNIETTTKLFKTTYNVYISCGQEENYWTDDFHSITQINEAITAIEILRDKIVNSLNGNDYQNIKEIHNYLVDSIEYDSTYSSVGTYSIYGALIEKKCVCEGYAKALKYLINAIGLDCELMQGTATNTSGQTENHAWNCVKLNDIWYEIDATWDDPIILSGSHKIEDSIRYKYFLKGQQSFSKDHNLEYKFSEKGKDFYYPKINLQNY